MVGIRSECWVGLEDLEPALRGYLRGRCRDESEVDDLVQDTLLRAARYRMSLADPGRLRSWILSIASNLLRDHVRRECRLRRAEGSERVLEDLAGSDDPPSPETDEPLWSIGRKAAVGQETALRHVTLAMRGLRARDRHLLRSYYERELGCAESAAECGIAPALVKLRLFRVRRRLARAVRRSLANSPRACRSV